MTDQEFRIHKPLAQISQSQQPVVLESLEEYPYKSVAMASTRANLTGLWRYWRSYYQTKRAPCDAACPTGNQVVDFIQTLLDGNWTEAANILRSENPVPAVTGRVCHRPCEMSCNRRQYDQRIAIHDIEAVLAEVPYEATQFPGNEHPRAVAVVGSGPAELSFAHFMALLNHRVTLFETADALGGRLRSGPQARHLPEGLLDAEIERIVAGRIEIQFRSVQLDDLKANYDAIFGVLETPDQLTLYVSSTEEQSAGPEAEPRDALPGAVSQLAAQVPLRVSEAIGYGKWAALLLDSDYRGLNPADTLAAIQIGGNSRIVSALKYLAYLTDHEVKRSEDLVTYDMLKLKMLESPAAIEPADAARALEFVSSKFVSGKNITQVMEEAARCLSCGRCNGCDNCWIYCPDIAISHDGGRYEIDYDYCKGCSLCAAVCPRAVISIIEEEKWRG